MMPAAHREKEMIRVGQEPGAGCEGTTGTARGENGVREPQGKAAAASASAPVIVSRHDRDRRVVRTKRAIREAFFALAERQDYRKITIAALAREADIDRKTFYLHYPSIDALLDEIARDQGETLIATCRDAMLAGDGHIDVRALFDQMVRGLSTDSAFDRDRGRRLARHIPFDDLLRRMEKPLIESVIDSDAFAAGSDRAYVPFWVSFFCAGLLSAYRRWLFVGDDLPLDDLARAMEVAMSEGMDGVMRRQAARR